MRIRAKALAAGAIVVVVLLGSAVAAQASRFAIRNSLGTRVWRATWNEFRFSGVFGTVSCSLTLEGSMHSGTIVKTRGTLIGYVTGGSSISGCGFFNSRVLTTNLPWHVRYASFSGTLPNPTRVNMEIIGFEYWIRESLVACLFRSTEEQPLSMLWSRGGEAGAVTRSEVAGTITGDCGIDGTFYGASSTFTPSWSITLI